VSTAVELARAEVWVRKGLQVDFAGIEFAGTETRFQELEQRSNRLAQRLLNDGFVRGDRVAIYLTNRVEFIEIHLAALKAGLIFTPINVLYREREIRHILEDAEPRGVFTSLDREACVRAAIPPSSRCAIYRAEDLAELCEGSPDEAPAVDTNEGSIGCLIYTSGTTGRPKGAMLTHGNLAANARGLIEAWRLTAEDRLLLPLPLFHVHGLCNGLHTWFALGYRLRLLERFRKETIVDELMDFRPTVLFGVPTMYQRLLETPPELAREIGRHARLFVSGSAPLSPAIHERFEELFGHVILERYGMTETLMNISNPYEGERRAGAVGFPLPEVSIRVADPETGELRGDGETGEVQIKGPNVFPGYWRREDATAEAFTDDGFFRSGDLGSRSADGYYTLHGRRKELIICGGFNIYPREVEEFLQEQEGVAEAAVVGVADAVKGEVPVAFVVADGGECGPEMLASACREQLASFKVPRRFEFVERLPRNALGKVQKHLLGAEREMMIE
jgi:malonyl-CoA/methylmalonyl-CoA synthetase